MTLSRRRFVSVGAASVLACGAPLIVDQSFLQPACAAEPFVRKNGPRFRIGLSAYSLRPHFEFMKGKPQKSKTSESVGVPSKLSMLDFLDYCVEQQIDVAELTSYFFEPGPDGFPTDDALRTLKREAFLRGVTVSGTAIGNNFTVGRGIKFDQEVVDAKRWIEKASILGAPHIRFFAGTAEQLAAAPTRMDEAVDGLLQCAKLAEQRGIFIGVENHGRLNSDQMLEIMSRVQSPWVGINLDTGNFQTEEPYRDLERCVPFAVNVQVKTQMRRPDGTRYPADLDKVGSILRNSNYQGFVVLEYEEDDPYRQIPIQMKRLRQALQA